MANQKDQNRIIEASYTVEDDESNPLIDGVFLPKAPEHMEYEARMFWDKTLLSLPCDWFISADLALFEIYCNTYVQYNRYLEAAKGQEVYEDDKGVLRTSPYVTMAEKARSSFMAMTGKLKLNVKSRDGDTIKASREEAKKQEVTAKSTRRKGLMFIPGGRPD